MERLAPGRVARRTRRVAMSRRFLTFVFAAGALAGVTLTTGCVLHGRTAVVVDAEPPPPRYVEVDFRPGYIWIDGHWAYRGSQWIWMDGYYERERPGHVYVHGSWSRRGGRWHWVEPRWQRGHGRVRRDVRSPRYRGSSRAPAVRDHRSRPATRDHRAPKPRARDHRDNGRGRIDKRDHRDNRRDKIRRRDHRD